MAEPLIAIVGPTASGKSDLGIALAQEFSGEIINADSVQVYRDLYVATAKVPPAEQGGIRHHLIDIADPTENFTAVRWAEMARQTIASIEARGKRAFLAGGTGFYLKALTTRFFEAPPVDLALRIRIQSLLARKGAQHLHRMLGRLDPVSALRFQERDWVRVIRALEVYFTSGKTLARLQEEYPVMPTPEASRLHLLVLEPPRQELYERINRRADEMIGRGLLTEIEGLIAKGVPYDAKAFGAHGYRRFVEYLQGMRTLESAVEQMKLDTRHYAKRQWSWWRAQNNTWWLRGFGFEEQVIKEATRITATLLEGRQP